MQQSEKNKGNKYLQSTSQESPSPTIPKQKTGTDHQYI